MDDANSDSDSQSITSTHSTSSSSSRKKKSAILPDSKDLFTPSSKQNVQRRKQMEDDSKITPKRKKEHPPTPICNTPVTGSSRKIAPLSERQQMAIALAMSAQESGGTSPQQSAAASTTPKSANAKKVNKRNEKGESPLHIATIKGDVDAMKRLLKAGADVNVQDFAGWTALHEACNHGFVKAAKLLVKSGANVNTQGLDNDTPLHDAAINGHRELVALLLKYGANAYQPNSHGKSPLDVAKNEDIRKLLRKEDIHLLASDDSDASSSSPGSVSPKYDEPLQSETVVDLSMNSQLNNEKLISKTISEAFTAYNNLVSSDYSQYSYMNTSMDRGHPNSSFMQSTGTSNTIANLTAYHPAYIEHRRADVMQAGFLSKINSSENCVDDSGKRTDNEKSTDDLGLCDKKQEVKSSINVAVGKASDQAMSSLLVKPAESKESYDKALTSHKTPASYSESSVMQKAAQVSQLELPRTARQSLNFSPLTIKPLEERSSVLTNKPAAHSSKPTPNEASVDQPSTAVIENSMSSVPAQSVPAKGESQSVIDEVKDNTVVAMLHLSGQGPTLTKLKEQKIQDSKNEERKSTEEVKQSEAEHKANASDVASKSEQKLPLTKKKLESGTEKLRQTARKPKQQMFALAEQPLPVDGENSKDSTDSQTSIISNNGPTRTSRTRNKPVSSVPGGQEEEVSSTRETRRKAMLKDKVSSTLMATERTAKSASPKVPPLTIKLANKSGQSTATKDSTNQMSSCLDSTNSTLEKEQSLMTGKEENLEVGKDSKEPNNQPPSSSQSALTSTTASVVTPSSGSAGGVTTRGRTLRSHASKNQGAGIEKFEEHVPPRKNKRMKADPPAQVPNPVQPISYNPTPSPMTIFNPYSLFRDIKTQVFKKWEKATVQHPRAPPGYSDFSINTKNYLLMKSSNTNASKMAIPLLVAPSHLHVDLKELFTKQEQERYKLRQQHLVESDRLRIAYEQELVRVYTRGACAQANQDMPLSVCTVLKDLESSSVHHPYNALKESIGSDDKLVNDKVSARSHYNNRQFRSWVQDIEDKFEKLKDQMISRHHHEAESLYALQIMNWEWKMKECGVCDSKSLPVVDELHVPMVIVNDDVDILNSCT